MAERQARDIALLDALDGQEGVPFDGPVWRIVREGRDPLQGYPSAGRWDPGTFDVIYTSLRREGALEEIHFHLSRQPVFPSRLRSILHRVRARTTRTLRLADMAALSRLGVSAEAYRDLNYARTQEIGDAAAFLGFDGILAPSARWRCQNLILFTGCFAPGELRVEASEPVDWAAWIAARRELRAGDE